MKKLRRQRQRFEGLSVGLDLHQQYTQVSVLDEAGDERLSERIASRPEPLAALVDRLTLEGAAVHVAAPSKVRAIADSQEKNDANDAWPPEWAGVADA